MSAVAKPFQQATVRAAEAALRRDEGTRRFLVADEVGLGKTVVARDVIGKLIARRRKPLAVFYVTSGKVGDQNKRDLLECLPESERPQALSGADRLGLMPFTDPPKGRVHLYALTPGTSFPAAGSRSSPGRAMERAFVCKLLLACDPEAHRTLGTAFFQLSASKSWPDALKAAKKVMRAGTGRLVPAFAKALRAEFSPLSVRDAVTAGADRPYALIARLRRALAEASLAANPPDLVILDEFQCYRRLLFPEAGDRLAAQLFGRDTAPSRRPAALLLSATPYRSYAERWEAGPGSQPHREFFEIISFLAGATTSAAVASAFERFGETLQALGRLPAGSDHSTLLTEAHAIKSELEGLLRPHVSRTERIVRDDGSGHAREAGKADLKGTDLDTYRHFATPISKRLRSSAMAYWLSVPLPAQALGLAYQISRGVTFGSPSWVPKISSNRLYTAPVDGWGSAKLRRLHDIADPDSLALPWVAPSLPWWPAGGAWAGATPRKLLIFSRFRATPPSIASLTSLEVERRLLARSAESYRKAWRVRRLQPKRGQAATVALFHPSPFLIEAVDVLKGSDSSSPRRVRAAVRRQLKQALLRLGVEVGGPSAKEARRHRPGWEVIAALDRKAGYETVVHRAWRPLGDRDAALARLLADWKQARPLSWVSPREFDDLVAMAMGGPAIAIGRALRRHHGDTLQAGLHSLVRLCWKGLRTYLDNPVFWAKLGRGTPTEALQRAVVDGGFEAVMDEHFWIRGAKKNGGKLADDLLEAFDAQVGWFTFRSLQNQRDGVRVRCHAAVPFGGTESERSAEGPAGDRSHRSEGVRAAFNTPFWPHVLVTTSVGQEGLDFHTWCERIGHWDLCSSPVDLEQREGRIQRFGGLVIRRRLGTDLSEPGRVAGRQGQSPWAALAEAAGEHLSDEMGLSPWWTLPGAEVSRHLFALPRSRDVLRFERLCRQRSLYRLALGQPRQEELVEMLGAKDPEVICELARLALDLSAFGAEQAAIDPLQEAAE